MKIVSAQYLDQSGAPVGDPFLDEEEMPDAFDAQRYLKSKLGLGTFNVLMTVDGAQKTWTKAEVYK